MQSRRICDFLNCEQTFCSESSYSLHIRSQHTRKSPPHCRTCKLCSPADAKKYNFNTDLQRHIKCRHKHLVFECPICDKVLMRATSLKAHLQRFHAAAHNASALIPDIDPVPHSSEQSPCPSSPSSLENSNSTMFIDHATFQEATIDRCMEITKSKFNYHLFI